MIYSAGPYILRLLFCRAMEESCAELITSDRERACSSTDFENGLVPGGDRNPENCFFHCLSSQCFRKVYAKDPLEPGEVSQDWILEKK